MTTPEAQARHPQKDYADWITGDEPITGAQMSYLTTLAQRSRQQYDFDFDTMTKAQAGQLIEQLRNEFLGISQTAPPEAPWAA